MTNELYHFGVKGMRWGVRRSRGDTKSALSKEDKRYDKLAKKDAKEYARAKMFYGESAGTRRKLIKNTVAQRRKENAHYGKAFDDYLSKQNMAKHVGAAKRERKAKDAANFTRWAGKKVLNTALMMGDNNYSYSGGEQMNNELYHFGVRGMKWGQRRYQNQDGSYTAQGRGRYDPNGSSSSRSRRSSSGDSHARLKKAAKIGAGVAAAGLAAYGGYRLAKSGKLSGLSSGVKSAASRVRSSNAGKKVGSGARRVANKVSNSGVGKRVQRGVNSAQYHATRIKNEMAYRRATSGGRNIRSNVIGIGGPKYSKVGAATYRVRSAASKARDVARTASSNSRRRAGELSSRMNSAASRYREMNKANRGAIRRNAIKVAGIGAGAGMVGYGATGIYAQTKKYRDARRRGRQNRR